MRLILGITLVLVGIGIWFCNIDGSAASTAALAAPEVPWVRTADGWERAGAWLAEPDATPRLHPVVVAAGQLFISLFGLTLWAWRVEEDDLSAMGASVS